MVDGDGGGGFGYFGGEEGEEDGLMDEAMGREGFGDDVVLGVLERWI